MHQEQNTQEHLIQALPSHPPTSTSEVLAADALGSEDESNSRKSEVSRIRKLEFFLLSTLQLWNTSTKAAVPSPVKEGHR